MSGTGPARPFQRRPGRPPNRTTDPQRAVSELSGLIRYLASQLVERPDAIQIRSRRRGRAVIIRLSVASDQLGKVIGREGRIARAMRTLLSIAAIRHGVHASLTIDDQIEPEQPPATEA